MQTTVSHYLLLIIVLILGFSCSEKVLNQPTTKDSNDTVEKFPKDFSFLSDDNPSLSKDSLYAFYQEIKVYPKKITHTPYGGVFWNAASQRFISYDFTTFNKKLELLPTNRKMNIRPIFCYTNIPIVAFQQWDKLVFFDLKTQKTTKKHRIKGTGIVSYTKSSNNQTKVVSLNLNHTIAYTYTFKEDNIVKIDSTKLEESFGIPAAHPSQNLLVGFHHKEFKVIDISEQRIVNRLKFEFENCNIRFSENGKRLILTDKGFNLARESRIKVLSFPELTEIIDYRYRDDLKISLNKNQLLVGDNSGNIALFNLDTGNVIYSKKAATAIRAVSIINEKEILLCKFKEKNYELEIRNIEKDETIQSTQTFDLQTLPFGFSPDSKFLYCYDNQMCSKINLKTSEITPIKQLNTMSMPTISSDGKVVAYKDFNNYINLLHLQDGRTEKLFQSFGYIFFGKRPNELAIQLTDSILVFNIDEKAKVRTINKAFKPRINLLFSSLTQKNPLNQNESIYSTETYLEGITFSMNLLMKQEIHLTLKISLKSIGYNSLV